MCDIKWIIEEPDFFFKREFESRKAGQKRHCVKRREARAARSVDKEQVT
jgi:hypothetical protein